VAERTDRRAFLRGPFARTGLGVLVLGLVAPLLELLLRRGRAGEGAWRAVARLDDLREGAPAPFAYAVRAGWRTRKAHGFLVRRGGEVTAFRAACTHLGCRVRASKGGFSCPCHGGAFTLEGAPSAGPVTRPLERLEARVAGGRVEVKA